MHWSGWAKCTFSVEVSMSKTHNLNGSWWAACCFLMNDGVCGWIVVSCFGNKRKLNVYPWQTLLADAYLVVEEDGVRFVIVEIRKNFSFFHRSRQVELGEDELPQSSGRTPSMESIMSWSKESRLYIQNAMTVQIALDNSISLTSKYNAKISLITPIYRWSNISTASFHLWLSS